MTLPERITSKFTVDPESGCWVWTGSTGRRGYGQIKMLGKNRAAHRVVYELLAGPIPDGLQIDHLCRNAACVNPEHMEPVTQAENIRRALPTHCPKGHAYDEVNTYWTPQRDPRWQRHRGCRACMRERDKQRDYGAEKRRRRARSG